MSETSFAAPEAPGHSTTSAGSARAGFWTRFRASFIDGLLVGVVDTILRVALHGAGVGLGLVVSLAYYTYLEGSTGQTLGKRVCAIRVADAITGEPIGYTRALLRWVGRIISTIPILLGYFWMLWDGNRQTWHDKIANSVVVPVA